jgi:CRISPR/Cas system-associated exonuclease Cas4 (RecB family)
MNGIAEKLVAVREQRTPQEFRPHLGASMIGAPCSRALWYGFRWCKKMNFDGRMLRLFETGQLAESRFTEELRWAGYEVSEGPSIGQQWRFSAVDGHFGGSMDAAANIDNEWHVCEFKTHNDKSFKELNDKGVSDAKPQHYCQMQIYMHLSGMKKALYLAVNKNTDALYAEIIAYSEQTAIALLERAKSIIYADEPPLGVDNYHCNYCDYYKLCKEHDAPYPTCRSCAHVTPTKDGWQCEFKGIGLTVDAQQKGCNEHRHIPKLLSSWAELVDANGHDVTYKNLLNGEYFNNSEGGANDYNSFEIYACQGKRVIGDKMLEEVREEFEVRIVESIE